MCHMFNSFLVYYRPQRKFAKVMFLHMSVSHSVHRGGCLGPGPGGRLGGLPGDGGVQAQALGVWACPGPDPGGVYPSMHWGRHPPQMATVADGMHPTRMHSCLYNFYRPYPEGGGMHPRAGLHPGGLHPEVAGRSAFRRGGWADSPGSAYRGRRYMRYYGIWSTSGQYESYRNAFLLIFIVTFKIRNSSIAERHSKS